MTPTAALRSAWARLTTGWLPIVESIVAATGAWLLDERLLGHPQPFFAPAAALIVLGQARGQRIHRTFEILLGVAGGVLVTDAVVRALGPHTTLTVFAIIASTLVAAAALGASTLFTVQATVSALYIAVVTPPTHSAIPTRFTDALVGGTVAVLVSQLTAARNPLAPLTREAHAVLGDVAAVLDSLSDALDAGDEQATREGLGQARAAEAGVQRLEAAVTAADEALTVHLRRREGRSRVQSLDGAARQVDYVVRNVRVLARACVTLTRQHVTSPPQLAVALRALAEAVRAVDEALVADLSGSAEAAEAATELARSRTVDAVRAAAGLLHDRQALPVVMIVGQLRATAIDLMRGLGTDDLESLDRVDAALGLPQV